MRTCVVRLCVVLSAVRYPPRASPGGPLYLLRGTAEPTWSKPSYTLLGSSELEGASRPAIVCVARGGEHTYREHVGVNDTDALTLEIHISVAWRWLASRLLANARPSKSSKLHGPAYRPWEPMGAHGSPRGHGASAPLRVAQLIHPLLDSSCTISLLAFPARDPIETLLPKPSPSLLLLLQVPTTPQIRRFFARHPLFDSPRLGGFRPTEIQSVQS